MAATGLLLGSGVGIVASRADPAPLPAWDATAVNVESGLLWEIGSGTPIAYRLVPTLLSWRSKAFLDFALPDGSRVVLRHRVTLVGTWVEHGPEHHYFALDGSPSLEWWDKSGTWSLYSGAGGGVGVIDSQGVKGGMGQDLTLNWFIRGGIEHITSSRCHVTAGIMYQHMSNGGMTKPNPGIDALGPTVGFSLKF
jgi:hypothetical protein